MSNGVKAIMSNATQRVIDAPKNEAAHQELAASTRALLAGKPDALKAFNGLTNSKGYRALGPDRQTAVLKTAKDLGNHRAAFEAMGRIVGTQHFKNLTDAQFRTVQKTLTANRSNLDTQAKAYTLILNDRPFEYAKDSIKQRVLSKPTFYAPRTMTWLQPDPRHHLPTKKGLDGWAANYRATHPERKVGNRHASNLRHGR